MERVDAELLPLWTTGIASVATALNRSVQDAALAILTVADENTINTSPGANASAIVLKEEEIEALPDNEEDLEEALRALAGPSAGPNGGGIYIDGFSGGGLPPRDTIREIRINSNPFSSEFDRLGYGRIEIFTKPGTDRLRGSFEMEFEDEKEYKLSQLLKKEKDSLIYEYDFGDS